MIPQLWWETSLVHYLDRQAKQVLQELNKSWKKCTNTNENTYYRWLPTEATRTRFLCMNQPHSCEELSSCLISLWRPSSVNDNQSKSSSVCRKTRPRPFASLTKEPRLLIVQKIWWDLNVNKNRRNFRRLVKCPMRTLYILSVFINHDFTYHPETPSCSFLERSTFFVSQQCRQRKWNFCSNYRSKNNASWYYVCSFSMFSPYLSIIWQKYSEIVIVPKDWVAC